MVTDSNGVAEFRNVPEGLLYFHAEPDNGFGMELNVKPNGRVNAAVPMHWPSTKPIHVRSLSGTMRDPDAVPGKREQPILPLELLEGAPGRIVAAANTSARGEFDFGKRAPGLYFIRVNATFGGLISVLLDPNAPERANKLNLTLSWTSCGLMYTDPLQ